MSQVSCDCRHRFPSGFELSVSFATSHRITGLIGPSGSGKTTLLNILAGLLKPCEGRIRLAERTLLDTRANINLPPERRHIGFVFQDHLLFPHLSVAGNLRYGQPRQARQASPTAVPCKPVEYQRVVEVLELGGLVDRYPRNLSGGERQRVALGRALLSGPELLLLDEPLAALDAALKGRVLDYLQRAIDEWQIPTIYVSHTADEVRQLCDWALVLCEGHLTASGPPQEVIATERGT